MIGFAFMFGGVFFFAVSLALMVGGDPLSTAPFYTMGIMVLLMIIGGILIMQSLSWPPTT